MKYIVNTSIFILLLISSCKKETVKPLPDVVVCNVKTSAETPIKINGNEYVFHSGSYHDAGTHFNLNFLGQAGKYGRYGEELRFPNIPPKVGKYNLYFNENNIKIPRANYSVWDIDAPIDNSNSYDSTANWIEITEICEEGGIKGKAKLKLKQKDGFYYSYYYYGNVKELNIEFSFAIKKRN